MTVKRIVANIATEQLSKAKAFYGDILDLDVVMDLEWIITFASKRSAAPQISFASNGGSETAVPDISIEVDNLDDVYQRALAAGIEIEYGPADEPWGIRRFYIRDPFGRLINILTHN